MAKKKKYTVLIDMNFSQHYHVIATGKVDAKNKAWEKFKKQIPKKDFTIDAQTFE